MVTLLLVLLGVFPTATMVRGSGYPKDTTTEWCAMLDDPEQVYQCFPNPWGTGSTIHWYRIPASEGIGGCLNYMNLRVAIDSATWILGGGGPPYMNRITLDQDVECLADYRGLVVNRAKPGDSIDIEFKMTPADTSVADTIRGWFKAYYRGDLVGYVPVAPKLSSAQAPRWTPSGLVLARGTTGPFDLRDLRGRSLPVRPVPHGDQVLLQPVAPLRPGLYRMRWPGGSAAFLVPGL